MSEQIKYAFVRSLKPTMKVSVIMLKVFIPLSVATLLLKQMGVLDLLAPIFAPVMSFMGLPGEAAITLLVGFTNTVYASLATAAVMELTARQITILGVVIGIAHSLLIETGILANLRMATVGIALFRIAVGLSAGVILNLVMPEISGTFVRHVAAEAVFSWPDALLHVGITSVQIVVIIFSIIFAYEIISVWSGYNRLIEHARSLTSAVGISEKAVAPWIVGVLVGITYGAALLYQFNEKQEMGHKDVCLITVFLCLAHAMIEDTLVFAVIGGNLAWIFVARIIIAVVVVRLLASGDVYKRFLWIGLPKERTAVKQ
jgi:hypothetical protein